MANWIFITTTQQTDAGALTGRQILETRMTDEFWGLGEKTPNRKALKKGDRIIFYVGAPESVFAATATLASDSLSVPEERKEALSHGNNFFRAEYGVDLDAVSIWPTPKPITELAPNLEFIGKRQDWWCFLQGGVRGVSDADYQRILQHIPGKVEAPAVIASVAEPTANEHMFALEKHLEEFIDKNWVKISWGRKLVLYSSDAGSGRQFPAGIWNIDFLATGD
jgi:hypothetical protein